MTEYLWTPWRMSYIAGASGGSNSSQAESAPTQFDAAPEERLPQMESTGCVFCDRVRLPETHDRASLILLRAEYSFVILNLYPYNSAHLMVVPYHHTADYVGLSTETLAETSALAQRMVRVITAEYHPQGYNLGMNLGRVAGAGVADHLHLHVVPRWEGDTNFMPIVGATKVMPELLETTYDRLKARMEEV
jgi:ATP adenylyltransferase